MVNWSHAILTIRMWKTIKMLPTAEQDSSLSSMSHVDYHLMGISREIYHRLLFLQTTMLPLDSYSFAIEVEDFGSIMDTSSSQAKDAEMNRRVCFKHMKSFMVP